ncbi:hypothetical protein K420107F6_18940 [Lactonifactor longoviformis]
MIQQNGIVISAMPFCCTEGLYIIAGLCRIEENKESEAYEHEENKDRNSGGGWDRCSDGENNHKDAPG